MELPVASNAFQIKPDLENILHTGTVKDLIQKVITETLLSEKQIVESQTSFIKNYFTCRQNLLD